MKNIKQSLRSSLSVAGLKTRFDREDDVLTIFLGKGKIDDTQQSGNVIAHLSSKGEVLLLEILNASEFLKAQSRALPKDVKEQIFASA